MVASAVSVVRKRDFGQRITQQLGLGLVVLLYNGSRSDVGMLKMSSATKHEC